MELAIVSVVARSIEEFVAVFIAVSAMNKLLRVSCGKLLMWRPSWLSYRWFQGAVLVLSLIELTYAISMFVPFGWLRAVGRILTLTLGPVVTTYGLLSIAKTGHCGCHGTIKSRRHNTKVQASVLVIVRNLVLFSVSSCALTDGQYGDMLWRTWSPLDVARSAQFATVGLLIALFALKGARQIRAALRWQTAALSQPSAK
jgi:hypothetical protein